MFLVPRFFLFYRFPITSAKVRRLFLSAKYLNLPCMKCHSVCTKWQRGGVISLNYSWRITVDLRMHITCCASAYQLICKRTTAVVRPEILTNSKTYTIFSNNLYYVFQQHISNIPTNKKGWIIYLWARPAPYQLRTRSVPTLSLRKVCKVCCKHIKNHSSSIRPFQPPVNIYNQNLYTYKYWI